MRFFDELKRRHVFKVAIVYIVTAWLILQVSDVILGNIGSPKWVFIVILLLLIIGLPITVIFAWAFDLTPDGLKRTDLLDQAAAASELSDMTAAPPAASVAVLPFVNMSGDPENEYFSDGLSEELMNVLSKIKLLKVAARTSSFHFKGQTGDIAEIARQLGVASVLEGSVRQAGDRVRVTAQLINAADGFHLWSETFDPELTDIFAVQDEIASAVADALKVKLLNQDADYRFIGGTTNTEAFQAYLQGVHHRNRGDDKEAHRAAAKAFQKAVDLDPEYAKAHVGLAYTWGYMAANSFVTYEEGVGNMETGVARALELAPGLAEAHLAQGFLLLNFKNDQLGASKAFNTALELNPGNFEVQIEYARMKCYQGHYDEGIAAAKRALELDPVSLFANHSLGHVLYFSRHYDEAIPILRHVLEMDPDYPKPHYFIAMSLFWQGHIDAAWEDIQQEPLHWMKWAASAVILHRLGRIDEAEANLAQLGGREEDPGCATIQQADAYAQWGNPEMAFKNLDLAFEYGDAGLAQLLVDPFLDPIRDDPRFVEMLNKLGFASG